MIDIFGIVKENLNRDDEIYSPIFGVGLFYEANDTTNEIECRFPNFEFMPYVMMSEDIRRCRKFDYIKFDRYGRCTLMNSDGKKITSVECVLFPSDDNRNWYTVRKDLPRGTIVVVRKNKKGSWEVGKYDGKGRIVGNSIDDAYNEYEYIIPLNKFNYDNIGESTKYNYARGHICSTEKEVETQTIQ